MELFLLMAFSAIITFLIQLVLCFKVKHSIFRHASLLFAVIDILFLLYILCIDTGGFHVINLIVAMIPTIILVLILIGYGLARLYYFIYLTIKKLRQKVNKARI